MKAKTLGGRKIPGVMNVLERAFSMQLDTMLKKGTILEWAYEAEKLKLRDCWYCPDFRVIDADGVISFYECKARHKYFEKGLLKLKLSAEMHPYHFRLVERKAGRWVITDI